MKIVRDISLIKCTECEQNANVLIEIGEAVAYLCPVCIQRIFEFITTKVDND